MTIPLQGILLDSDYIIAAAIENESTHARARAISREVLDHTKYILRSTLYEFATVTSRKFGQDLAIHLLDDLQKMAVNILEMPDIEALAWKEFYTHTKKPTSFFDCANLVAAKHYGLKIASFDQFYPKSLRVS